MELVLGQVGRQAKNPVRVPAESFRVLLKLEGKKACDEQRNEK